MSAFMEYECRVPVDGYDVITGIRPGGSEKIRMLHPRSKRTRRFDLWEFNSSAFLEFAQTPLTEDRIKDFADRYGPLAYDRVEGYEKWARCIPYWFESIRYMRRTVELWRKSTVTGDFSRILREVRQFYEMDYEKDIGVEVGVLLKKDPLSGSPKLCIRPASFEEGLWVQLLLAIDGNLNLRACEQCRKWFRREAGRGRSDKEYCSNACRMRAYRKRKGSG